MGDSKQRSLLIATLAYNVAALGFLAYIAFGVGVALPESRVPWWFLLVLASVMIIVANALWALTFWLLAIKVLLVTGVLRGSVRVFMRVFIRKSDRSQPEPVAPEIGQEIERKLDQAMRWSSFPLVAVPITCLLGVVVFDVVTPKTPLSLYIIFLSHCCVGLIGWILALRNVIGPLPIEFGDGGAMSG